MKIELLSEKVRDPGPEEGIMISELVFPVLKYGVLTWVLAPKQMHPKQTECTS